MCCLAPDLTHSAPSRAESCTRHRFGRAIARRCYLETQARRARPVPGALLSSSAVEAITHALDVGRVAAASAGTGCMGTRSFPSFTCVAA